MFRFFSRFYFFSLFLILSSCLKLTQPAEITKPKLSNNPSLDVICTNQRPLLSFFISTGGIGKKNYTIQLDTSPLFNSPDLIEYQNVKELNQFLVEKRVEEPLKDKSLYYWRAKAFDVDNNQSLWAESRFYIDTEYNQHFMGQVRVPVKEVLVSTGENPKNIIDYDDPGQISFWAAAPPGPEADWVLFDLGKETEISRIWMLSNFNQDNGWLIDFSWLSSLDGNNWEMIPGAQIKGNDTFRNILDIEPVKTRFLKLQIEKFKGVSAQLNTVIFYSPEMPPVPEAPAGKYVLLIGDQMNGGTYTQLAAYIKNLNLGLETLTVPHFAISLAILEKMKNPPVAIILSGNNADYPHLPMFEYNGVFEIIRNSNIPILGICAGHQMLAFASGYSFVRSMGWEDLSALEEAKQRYPIYILKEDPIFEGIESPFIAPEIHGWAIGLIPDDFELLAKSSYVQNIKHKTKFIYGTQFHPEVEVPYNHGKLLLSNFLKMALKLQN